MLGCRPATLGTWERVPPDVRFWPKILDFLGSRRSAPHAPTPISLLSPRW